MKHREKTEAELARMTSRELVAEAVAVMEAALDDLNEMESTLLRTAAYRKGSRLRAMVDEMRSDYVGMLATALGVQVRNGQ